MRNILIGLIGAAVAVSATPAFAHPEDEHGSNYTRGPSTNELAQRAIVKLVAQAKLPASWTSASITDFKVRTKKGAEQYVVKFENAKIRQPAKRFLYVIMTTDGKFVSANHKLV